MTASERACWRGERRRRETSEKARESTAKKEEADGEWRLCWTRSAKRKCVMLPCVASRRRPTPLYRTLDRIQPRGPLLRANNARDLARDGDGQVQWGAVSRGVEVRAGGAHNLVCASEGQGVFKGRGRGRTHRLGCSSSSSCRRTGSGTARASMHQFDSRRRPVRSHSPAREQCPPLP